MPKAKISVMISDRYSLTFGRNSMRGVGIGGDLLHPDRKPHQERHGDEIDDRRADREEHRRRDEIGQEGAALVLVEAGRDELVDLAGDDREGQEARAEGRDLDLGEQVFEPMRVDQMRVLGRTDRSHVGPDQDVVDDFAPAKQTKNISTKATSALIRRARSSVRCWIRGARDASTSSSSTIGSLIRLCESGLAGGDDGSGAACRLSRDGTRRPQIPPPGVGPMTSAS